VLYKINSLLRKRYRLISSDFITVNRDGIFISLKKGVTSTLVYENPKTKETFKVCYNSFKSYEVSNSDSRTEGSRTITQKPDYLLDIDKVGSEKAYEFVFDAKYKIDRAKEFLDKLINESSYSTFERSLEPIGKENYIKDEYVRDRTVLVGSLRNKEQLEINLKGKFYHTKCSNINLAEHNIKFVALAQSKRQFVDEAGITYYGKVVDIKVVKRNKINEIPSDSEEDYYLFQIEEWKKLHRKIEVKGYQVLRVIYSTEFLLNNASIVTELCIKSKEEYRLWQELKRESSLTETESHKNINRDSIIQGFSIDGMRVFIKDEKICVEYNENSYEFSKEEFNRRPKGVMERIFNIRRDASD
jgi:hypothetical protein